MNRAELVAAGDGRYTVRGPLTFDTVPGLLEGAGTEFPEGSRVVVSLAEVSRADSSAIALLLEWLARAGQRGCQLSFADWPEQLRSLVRIGGLEALLTPNPS